MAPTLLCLRMTERSDYTNCMSIANPLLSTPLEARSNRANPRQKAQRAETRERLIEGAIRVFAQQGYAQASVEDVLMEAGVSRASFYSHFAGKPGLVTAIADRLSPLWQPLYGELVRMQQPNLSNLEDWCRRSVDLYRAHQDICIILTQASAIELDLYWKLTAHRETVTSEFAVHNPALAHLSDDPAARLRAALALLQLDQACYYLAVRGWQADEAAGIEAMAMQLHHFLVTETARGGSR